MLHLQWAINRDQRYFEVSLAELRRRIYVEFLSENFEIHELEDSDGEGSDERTVSVDRDEDLLFNGEFVPDEERGLVGMPFYGVELEDDR